MSALPFFIDGDIKKLLFDNDVTLINQYGKKFEHSCNAEEYRGSMRCWIRQHMWLYIVGL